ncbi:MAG: hypothetical protein ED859_14085 [Desulfuromonadales bacterium]|nr:MAG: hypothetical protein ED859_14085 [Desulfuromonadales bacterium]
MGTTLRPGQKGTRELLKTYGDQLICVRYRYDKARGKRYKTVELIVDEQDWTPGTNIQPDRRVFIEIGYGEMELREEVKAAGGFWSPEKRAWVLSYRKVLLLGLEKRVIDEELGL